MRKDRQAAVWAAVLILVLLFFAAFIVLEADHDCHGEHCVVCAQLGACLDLLRLSAVSLSMLAAALLLRLGSGPAGQTTALSGCLISLIALKVKLSD